MAMMTTLMIAMVVMSEDSLRLVPRRSMMRMTTIITMVMAMMMRMMMTMVTMKMRMMKTLMRMLKTLMMMMLMMSSHPFHSRLLRVDYEPSMNIHLSVGFHL